MCSTRFFFICIYVAAHAARMANGGSAGDGKGGVRDSGDIDAGEVIGGGKAEEDGVSGREFHGRVDAAPERWLEWTLRRFFCLKPDAGDGVWEPPCELVVVYAKPHPNSIVSPAVPGAAEVIRWVDADLRKVAGAVVEKIRAICVANSVNALAKVVEGDAREALCTAAKEHQADILVLGSHGYGAIKRTLLGSVSEYCARHAHCTVMIVKKPKSKR